MNEPKFCVFCGKSPDSKNREHILPQWLLNLTGDPRRVVRFGYNFRTKKEVAFAWQALVVPACERCNEEHSELEGKVRPIIDAILARQDMSASNYLLLLDWLDKVRVGLWLNYHLIMGNPTQIAPSFHINQRIGKKDRFLAIYPMGKQPNGLNAYGAETLLFHRTPSVFMLRINDVLVLNASSDHLVSGRCGLPTPEVMEVALDGQNAGLMLCTKYRQTGKMEPQILNYDICRPSIFLLQPIASQGIAGDSCLHAVGEEPTKDAYVSEFITGSYLEGKGKLVQQFPGVAKRIDDSGDMVSFQSIPRDDCVSMGRLVAQTYEMQIWLQNRITVTATDKAHLVRWGKAQEHLIEINRMFANNYLAMATNFT